LAQVSSIDVDDEGESRLFSQEFLSRDDAIARFFTPKARSEQNYDVRLGRDRLVTLGNGAGTTLIYNPSVPYMNRQIREKYDVDHIGRIASDLETFGQLQECGIAAFTEESTLKDYISDSSDFYDSDVEMSEIHRHKRLGLWLVTIYGHNRQLAAASSNLKRNGHPDRGIQLRAHVHHNPTFLDFLHMQAVENTGQQPPPWSRARSMTRMFELGIRDGKNYTFKEIADCYGVDEDQVWRAHNYVQLPLSVSEIVEEDGSLSYSGAIELRRLVEVYAEQDIYSLGVEAIRKKWSAKQIAAEVTKRVNVRTLPEEFQALVESDIVKPKQAELIRDMHLAGASGPELRAFIMWITSEHNPPRLNEIREKVAARRSVSRAGQMDIFSGGYDDSTAVSERDRVAITNQRLSVGRVVSHIQGNIAILKHFLDNGAFVDIVDHNPIATAVGNLNGLLADSIDDLSEKIDMSSINELQQLINSLDGSLPPNIRDQIEDIIVSLGQVIYAEMNTDLADQQNRIKAARDRLRSVSSAQQEVLF
jgi:hypothetical protein